MKKRGRKHLIANKRATNPLRIDPTRTITLRRHMLDQVRRRFALLRGRIISLVVDEDAFGLRATINSFCPTGPGGGVDPSCSPHVKGDKVTYKGKDHVVDSVFDYAGESHAQLIGPKGKRVVVPVSSITGSSPTKPGQSATKPVPKQAVDPDPKPSERSEAKSESEVRKLFASLPKIDFDGNAGGDYVSTDHFMKPTTKKEMSAVQSKMASLVTQLTGDTSDSDKDWSSVLKQAPTKIVNLKDLKSTQRGVTMATISHMMDNLSEVEARASDTKGHKTPLAVAKYNGDLYVVEGHHRAVTKQFLGQSTASVKYIDLDSKSPIGNQFNPDQLRGQDGKWLGHGSPTTIFSSGDQGPRHDVQPHELLRPTIGEALKGIRAKIGGKLTEYIDKTPGGKFVRDKLASLNDKLKERYGEKTMGRILLAANVTSWSITIGTAAMGATIPVPASGLTLAGVALAEAHLQVTRGLRRVGVINEGDVWIDGVLFVNNEWLDGNEVQVEAEKLVRELIEAGHDGAGNYYIPVTDIRGHDEGARPRGPITDPDSVPPLTVGPDSYLVDGHHRLAGLKAGGSKWARVRFGHLLTTSPQENVGAPTGNRFQFTTSADKLRQFQDWLRQQYAQTVTSPTDEQLWRNYIDAGYRKGAGRAFDDAKAKPRAVAASAPLSPGEDNSSRFAGTRDEFLRSTFAQPVSRERVELLASRTFNDLENVTDDLSARLGRSLADGLTQGQSPRELAREMSADLDISQGRAELIARTEIIRAHSEGQLDSLKNMGVDEVGVQVEWLSTDDGRQCEDCASREGTTLTIDEARGLIPFHPQCRCAWAPVVPDPTENRRRYITVNFNPDQSRDDHGRFVGMGRDDALKEGFLYHGMDESKFKEFMSSDGFEGGGFSSTPQKLYGPRYLAIRQQDLPAPSYSQGGSAKTNVQYTFDKAHPNLTPLRSEHEAKTWGQAYALKWDHVYEADEHGTIIRHLGKTTSNQFNPDQPRDEHGRFTSGGSDLLHAKLDAAHHLSDEHRGKSRVALQYVLGKIPAAAHERLTAHLVDVQFHATAAELTQTIAATSPKVKEAMDRGATVNGVYRQQTKTLVLDGDVPRRAADDLWKKDRSNVHETYAHEISHAIDGPGFPLSGSQEWVDAWQREIGFTRPAPGTARLSVYATSAPHEGFAEFGRLVYGTNTNRSAIEKKFPMCAAYWKSQGLWQ